MIAARSRAASIDEPRQYTSRLIDAAALADPTGVGERFIAVRYEDLVSDTEECLRGVLDYVGLSLNVACHDYAKHGTGQGSPAPSLGRSMDDV